MLTRKLTRRITSVLVMLLLLCCNTMAQNWDVDLLNDINPRNPDAKEWELTSSSAYVVPAAGVLATFVAGLVKKDKHLKQESYKALINIAVSTAASEIMKYSINKTRPAFAYPGVIFEGGQRRGVTSHSFPSGHTTLAFNYATTLSLQYKKWYVVVPSYLWAAAVGYSRMYLGKHYPSDVLTGAVLGTVSGWLTNKLNKRIFKKK